MDRALAGLAAGRAPVLVISGEAGIGKTRLIEEALRRAGPDVRILRSECLALGSSIPYLPFAELLRDLVRQVPAADLAKIVGPARAELTRFLPELATAIGARGDGTVPERRRGDELERLRLYEAFLLVAERIAALQPTVFVIEDVQWIDPASLELLAFLVHGLQPHSRAGLIVSVRPEEVEGRDRLLTLLADLGRSATTERLELGPLDADAMRQLVAAVRPGQDGRIAQRIHSLSDGNPLFAEELLAASSDSPEGEALPPKLRDLLAARLASVPDEHLVVLRVAAAAGRTLDDQLLVRASGLDEDRVREALRAAVDDHILIPASGAGLSGYRFGHEMLRSLVASQLLPAEARRVHSAYAAALAEEPPARRNASEIANHWDAAGELERALPAHVEAGQRATETFAFEQAQQHFERALELWDRVDEPAVLTSDSRAEIMDRAASTAARAGDFERAIELTRAVTADRAGVDDETYDLARSSLRWYLWEAGHIEEAMAAAEAVVAAPAGVPDRWRANAMGHLAGLLLYDRRTEAARQQASQASQAAEAAGATEERILAEGVLGWCLLLEGDIDAGLEAIRRALEATLATEGLHMEGRYPVGPAFAHLHLAGALELVGRYEESYAVAVAGVELATGLGVARTFGSTLQASAARALYQLGRWSEAEAFVRRAIDAGAVASGRVALLASRALIAVGRGQGDDAARALADADAISGAAMPLDTRRWLTAAHAEQAVWEGRPSDALARLALVAADPEGGATDGSDRRVLGTPSGPPAILDASIPQLLALGARATADLALEERASGTTEGFAGVAMQRLETSLDRVRRRKALAAAWAGELAIARAELERVRGDAEARVRRWRAAVDAAAARPYAAAYARWRLAEAYLARRDGREAAAPQIGSALPVAVALGAGPLLRELEGLARRARLTVTSDAAGVAVAASSEERPFGLTTRELEVLRLLADGMSNQEIADELFISPKTASVHVSNIYSKLGVESRVAAATTAHALGLTGETESRST